MSKSSTRSGRDFPTCTHATSPDTIPCPTVSQRQKQTAARRGSDCHSRPPPRRWRIARPCEVRGRRRRAAATRAFKFPSMSELTVSNAESVRGTWPSLMAAVAASVAAAVLLHRLVGVPCSRRWPGSSRRSTIAAEIGSPPCVSKRAGSQALSFGTARSLPPFEDHNNSQEQGRTMTRSARDCEL